MKNIEVTVARRKWHLRLHAKKLEQAFKAKGKSIIDMEKKISKNKSYCQSLIYNYIYRFVMTSNKDGIELVLVSIIR